MATLSELQARLAEAETALHNALIGRGIATVRDFNGEAITYSRMDTAALRAYITELRSQIDAFTGTTTLSGPMRIFL